MNCLYIILFFNIVAGIVQIFIKSWNQFLYPRVIVVCRLPLNHFMTSSSTSLSSSKFRSVVKNLLFHLQTQWSPETHLLPVGSAWETSALKLRWEIVWRNAPHIWRDFGSSLPFQTRLTQTQPVLPLSNEHGLQVEDEGRRQCCHNKHQKFPYRPTRVVSLLSGHAS